jgi:hypothetical protein
MDKAATILIFILLSWWVVDEYIEGAEFEHVMAEHHAHFLLLANWHEEWRMLTDTYLEMWTHHHPKQDCDTEQ